MKGQVPKSLVQELSLNRANAVKEALVRKFPSLQPNQFSTAGIGLGPARPIRPTRRTTRRTAGSRSRSTRRKRRRPPSRCRGRREPLAAGAPSLAAAHDAAPGRRRRGGRGRAALVAGHAGRGRRGPARSRRSSCRARSKCSAASRSLLNERALLQSIAATLKRVLIGFGLAVARRRAARHPRRRRGAWSRPPPRRSRCSAATCRSPR